METIARRVADYQALEKPGDFFITEPNEHERGMRRLSFWCSCGKCVDKFTGLAGITIRDDGQQVDGSWGWNKNWDKPTCTPSIGIGVGNDHWHGHLIDGVFKSC